jgi:hypothetical protein
LPVAAGVIYANPEVMKKISKSYPFLFFTGLLLAYCLSVVMHYKMIQYPPVSETEIDKFKKELGDTIEKERERKL